MKPLFTYPNNSATNYIDPNYVGDTNEGLTKRMEDLRSGAYKPWLGLSPVVSLTTMLRMSSRFINYFEHNKDSVNLSFNDFWDTPVVVATLGLIDGVNVSSVNYNAGPPESTIITTDGAHDFDDGDLVTLNNFDLQMAEYNGNSYYVDTLSSTTLQLYQDSGLTNPLIVGANISGDTDKAHWSASSTTLGIYSNTTITKPAWNYEFDTVTINTSAFVPNPGSDPMVSLPDGTGVRINTVSYNGTGLQGNTYYTKQVGTDEYELYTSSGLGLPLRSTNVTGFPNTVKGRITIDFAKTFTGGIDYDSNQYGYDGYFTTWALDTENPVPKDVGQSQASVKVIGNYGVSFPGNNYINNLTFPYHWLRQADHTYMRLNSTTALTYPDFPSHTQVWGTDWNGDVWSNKDEYPRAPLYYAFNKYNNMTRNVDGTVDIQFCSQNGSPYVLNDDPTSYYTQRWSYDMLDTGKYTIYSMGQHCVQVFDGMSFNVTAREPIYNQPHEATIVNQPGKPILDPVDGYLYQSANTNNELRLASNIGGTLQHNHLPDWYAMSRESEDGLGDIAVVLWKPGANIENYRSPWDEFGNLNLMSRSTPGGNYDTNNYGVIKWDGQQWVNTNPGADALIVRVNYDTHDSTNNRVYSVYSQTPSRKLTLDAINAFWGTNITDYTSIKASPCPYDLENMGAYYSFNYTLNTQSYYNVGGQPDQENQWDIPLRNTYNGQGLVWQTAHYPYSGSRFPNTFILHNEVDLAPLSFGEIDADYYLANQAVATTGELAIDSGSPYKYEAKEVDIIFPGNDQFYHYDANGDYVPGAIISSTQYWIPGGTTSIDMTNTGETQCDITIGVDGNGRLSSATLVQGVGSEGSYINGGYIAIPLISAADINPPATPTPIEMADTWDTEDQWLSTGEGNKWWPSHVTPSSASIELNSPTIVNNSQNGFKYARKSGFTKWKLEVTYPPMTETEFQKFHAVAQAAQGQAIPFKFELKDKLGQPLLWSKFGKSRSTQTVYLKDTSLAPGSTTMLLDGFAYNEQNALTEGEVIKFAPENQNGKLYTVLNTVNANVYGEVKIRISHPLRANASAGDWIEVSPDSTIVTLADDGFAYTVGTDGYYRMSVTFDLDAWK